MALALGMPRRPGGGSLLGGGLLAARKRLGGRKLPRIPGEALRRRLASPTRFPDGRRQIAFAGRIVVDRLLFFHVKILQKIN
jgi:hypothetical protein